MWVGEWVCVWVGVYVSVCVCVGVYGWVKKIKKELQKVKVSM